ncbi:MAG: hypothetical protein HUU15_12405 [Candidatus Brocadiae bacterium]|nr:hypothetical protein [Candidatus Brocadiia bacterium]
MAKCCVLWVLVAGILAGCGQDPLEGRRKKSGSDALSAGPDLETGAGAMDPGLVAAWEVLVAARVGRDREGYLRGFAGGPGEDGESLFEESTNVRVVRLQRQYREQTLGADEARLVVRERIEERDPKNPEGQIHGQEVIVTATLVRAGGVWKVRGLKADWR